MKCWEVAGSSLVGRDQGFFAVFLSASSRAGWWNRVLGGVWGQTEVGLHFVVPFPAQSLELRSSTCSCMCKGY